MCLISDTSDTSLWYFSLYQATIYTCHRSLILSNAQTENENNAIVAIGSVSLVLYLHAISEMHFSINFLLTFCRWIEEYFVSISNNTLFGLFIGPGNTEQYKY